MFSIKSVLYQIKKCHWVSQKWLPPPANMFLVMLRGGTPPMKITSPRSQIENHDYYDKTYDGDGNKINQMQLLKMWSIIWIYPDNLYVSNRFCVSKIYSPWFSQPLLWEEHIYFAYWYKYVNMGRHVSEIDLCSSFKSKSAWSLTPFGYSVWLSIKDTYYLDSLLLTGWYILQQDLERGRKVPPCRQHRLSSLQCPRFHTGSFYEIFIFWHQWCNQVSIR